MSAPLLAAHGLSVEIGGHQVVRGLDLDIAAGQRLAILGRNGAGKSTLLATLAGLRPPATGRVDLGGNTYAELTPRGAALRRAWLGQTQADPFGSTVLETALTGRHPHLGRWDWESTRDAELARSALAAVGLDGMEERQIHTLSGGERQRLAIATHQMAVLELFAGAARDCGAGVIMVLHDPALAHRFCDRALLIDGDGNCELGAVDAVLTAEKLSALYGYPLRQFEQAGQRCFVPD